MSYSREQVIKVNAIRCRACGSRIESTSRHDFRTCPCGAVSVDGGVDYLRRVGKRSDWVELTEYEA